MIEINLNDLTKEMVEAALPFMGECNYSVCIIGRLMTPEDVKLLADLNKERDYIMTLCRDGVVSIPDNQKEDASLLQLYFDLGYEDIVWEFANKYIGGRHD